MVDGDTNIGFKSKFSCRQISEHLFVLAMHKPYKDTDFEIFLIDSKNDLDLKLDFV